MSRDISRAFLDLASPKKKTASGLVFYNFIISYDSLNGLVSFQRKKVEHARSVGCAVRLVFRRSRSRSSARSHIQKLIIGTYQTSFRHFEKFMFKVLTKLLQLFRSRCDNDENQRCPPTAIFVDDRNHVSARHN